VRLLPAQEGSYSAFGWLIVRFIDRFAQLGQALRLAGHVGSERQVDGVERPPRATHVDQLVEPFGAAFQDGVGADVEGFLEGIPRAEGSRKSDRSLVVARAMAAR
jgi:hypothetical protein